MNTANYRRKNRKHSTVQALTEAQKIAFAPLTFQAVGSMLDFGILKSLDNRPSTCADLIEILGLSEYTVRTLLEIGEVSGILEKGDDGVYMVTQVGKSFLYDEMTRVNFNFVKDVCYVGASEMTASFVKGKPEGLNKFFQKSDTIYPLVPSLPQKIKQSWYEFDHFYSDNCFEIIYKIITEKSPSKIFDIGGNTGKFEKVCLKNNPNIDITMLDLPENIEIVSKDVNLRGCKFYAKNVLNNEKPFPKMTGVILMSQFLDCFSKEQINFILTNISKAIDENTKVYILEPFTDNQIFGGARFSLTHTSLYFTCMANGNSKMYTKSEMSDIVEKSNLKIVNVYENLGPHDYTLLECEKK